MARRLTAKLRTTARRAIDLQERRANPDGTFDQAGRWYPSVRCDCCAEIRSPSRQWPYSLMVHCRTARHVAASTGYDLETLRWAMKRIREEGAARSGPAIAPDPAHLAHNAWTDRNPNPAPTSA